MGHLSADGERLRPSGGQSGVSQGALAERRKFSYALAAFCASGNHVFWPDDVSLCDEKTFSSRLPARSRQLTDVYLLGLCVAHGGMLVTFDRSIPLAAVVGAKTRHVQVLTA